MGRLALNKSSLSQQNRQLKTFERYLPSLDLKRRQLIAQRAKAAKAIEARQTAIEALQEQVARSLPMASNTEVTIDGLVRVSQVELDEENVMGVHLPRLARVQLEHRPYSLLAKPEWVDNFALRMAEMLELRIHIQVEQQRLTLLNEAVRTITQRVNLFDKVLIPRARENIRRIQIVIADAERAAVVRAKIAKDKRAKAVNP